MGRVHAFEFEDLKWFPRSLRNYATDFLQFGANRFDMYKPVISILQMGIEYAGNNTIVDIASGGGGGLLKIASHLKETNPALKIILSDYYPNHAAFERTKALMPETFEYVFEPVDARDVPPSLIGLTNPISFISSFQT